MITSSTKCAHRISNRYPTPRKYADYSNRSRRNPNSSRTRYYNKQAAGDGTDLPLPGAPNNLKSETCSPIKSLSTESTDDDSQSASKSDEYTAEERSNLIVNYLPPNTTQEDVRHLFSGVGEIENCKLVREKSTGESLGYAFVKYYCSADAEKAIESYNGMRLENKTIKVSIARPSCEAIRGANLYICGLPRSLTAEELEILFKPYGRLITTRILCDKETSISRGIAFIRFDQRSEAEKAIKCLNGYIFPNSNDVMLVKFANSPTSHHDGNRSTSSRSTGAPSRHRQRPRTPNYLSKVVSKQSKSCGTEDQNPTSDPTEVISSGTIAIKPQHFSAMKSAWPMPCYPAQFGVYGRELVNNAARMTPSTAWQRTQLEFRRLASWGYLNGTGGLSKFQHSTSGMRDIPTGIPLANFLLRSPASGHSRHLPSRRGGAANTYHESRDMPSSTRALFAPAYSANAGALTTNGWCIFVYNLSATTREAALWQLFGPFGAVQSVSIATDPTTGKCKGYGFVTMSNYEEAMRAIQALSGFILENRMINVAFRTVHRDEQRRSFHQSESGWWNEGGKSRRHTRRSEA